MNESISIALIGVGSCAVAVAHGQVFYQDHDGLLAFPSIGPYSARHVRIIQAFDVDRRKVGQPFGKVVGEVARAVSGDNFVFPILRGPTLDGIRGNLAGVVEEDPSAPVDVARVLKDSGVEVAVNLIPTGAEDASRHYAHAALEASCAFVNCTPARIARDPEIRRAFAHRGLPLIGDDVKSQFGSTWLHQILLDSMMRRGLRIVGTYQVNVGGNHDFLNLTDPTRGAAKRDTKTESLRAFTGGRVDLSVGNIAYAPWLGDRKDTYIRIDADGFAEHRIEVEARLRVNDSPNLGGTLFDVVRFCRLICDKQENPDGLLVAYVRMHYMKNPPEFKNPGDTERALIAFSQQSARTAEEG